MRWTNRCTLCLRSLLCVGGCLSQSTSLIPRVDNFVRNDGRHLRLLRIEGTIPIFFRGNTYHIPVSCPSLPCACRSFSREAFAVVRSPKIQYAFKAEFQYTNENITTHNRCRYGSQKVTPCKRQLPTLLQHKVLALTHHI